MEIKTIKRFAKTKNQVVINGYWIFKLNLRKEKHPILTAKNIGYTTEGIKNELFNKNLRRNKK